MLFAMFIGVLSCGFAGPPLSWTGLFLKLVADVPAFHLFWLEWLILRTTTVVTEQPSCLEKAWS